MSNPPAFLLTYLHRELRGRPVQTAVTAAGLAVGIALVLAVAAASSGVRDAEGKAVHSLYGVGTDLSVTPSAPRGRSDHPDPTSGRSDVLSLAPDGLLNAEAATQVARLAGVAAAAGALVMTDTRLPAGGDLPATFGIDGIDPARLDVGPFASAKLTSGRSFTAGDTRAGVAVLDSGYARANGLAVGSAVKIDGVHFTAIGIVAQPTTGGAADIYIPLQAAEALSQPQGTGDLAGKVNVIYVRAASDAEIPAVQKEISRVLPSATVTAADNIASVIRGSLASAAHLATDLGRWVELAALIAAVAAASLLMTGAVGRRLGELGTLKALGWSGRRIVAQILAESTVTGVIGALAGLALGLAATALIDAAAPTLAAAVFQPQNSDASVAVRLTARPTVAIALLSVALAFTGALIAGALGAWRAARMRPAAALTEPQ